MIKINNRVNIDQDLDKLIENNTIFMDIETTGFSRKNGRIYLIGFLSKKDGEYRFYQLMTEKQSEEKELLKVFSKILKEYNKLITFNGDSFDIPFIQARADKYFIPIDFESIESIDMYKDIKTRGFLLDIDNFQLNTIERYLGIYREDIFSGGDLIGLYYEFENTEDKRLEEFLLLHNKEDILNLPNLIKMDQILDNTNTILVNDNKFILDNLSVSQKGLSVSGRTSIEEGFLNYIPYELIIKERKFNLKGNIKKGKYDKNTSCLYVEKDDLDLNCSYNIKSPKQILILKHDKNILYKNVASLTKELLNQMFK